MWIEVEGARLHATVIGRGDPVVLLHGGMADHHAVMPYAAMLSNDFRVIAPDQRGSGKSWCGEPLGFDRLSRDLAAILEHLDARRPVVIGVSGGTGVAIHFALTYPRRVAGLGLILPVYAGAAEGLTPEQAGIFGWMDGIASQAVAQGIQAIRPLYAAAPEAMREQAIASAMTYDPASVVATSRFLASGEQPFADAEDLERITVPVMLVPGADAMHPVQVAERYRRHLPLAETAGVGDPDLSVVLGRFCSACHAVAEQGKE